jgi:hypothetical protein
MLKAFLSLIVTALMILAAIPAVASDNVNFVDELISQSATAQVACSSDYDCGYGNICEYGQCRPAQCTFDSQCFPWEECSQGRCQRDPWAQSCRQDSDCFGARICRLGYCKKW